MDIKTTNQIHKEDLKAKIIVKEKPHLWFTTYVIVAAVCLAVYFLLRFKAFTVLGSYRLLLQHLTLAGFFVFVVLMTTKGVELLVVKKSPVKSARYNLVRLIHLLSVVIAAFIIISFLFENWYTAAVSLGLISLILGFALQTPIS